MSENLRSKTLNGAMWTTLERVCTQGLGFLITVILSRLLSPSDYGVVGIVAVSLSFLQLFVDCGFASALIRKKNRTDMDCSTAFWCNISIACVCYLVVLIFAPFFSQFYNMPILTDLLRVLGISLIVDALYAVQVARFTALINFSVQAKIAIVRCMAGGTVGVFMAWRGLGVWSLVGQSLCSSVVGCLLYYLLSDWHPAFAFSKKSFRELFGFGVKLSASYLIHTIYTSLSPLIIGWKYSASDLGHYSRASSMSALPGSVFQSTLGRIIYPVLSSIQDDEVRLQFAYSRYLRIATSVVVPFMLMLAAVGEPLIVCLIGEKWLPCVPYFQVLAIGVMIDPIIQINLNALYVKGRSDVVLKMEFLKKVIAILIVITTVQFGVFWLCIGGAVYAYIALFINMHFCAPYIGIGLFKQIKDVLPIYLVAVACAGVAFCIAHVMFVNKMCLIANGYPLVALVASALIGGGFYCLCAVLLDFDIVKEIKLLIKQRLV